MKPAQVARCGPFVPDPDLPHLTHDGKRVCRECHLPGKPGDPHHDTADLDEAQAAERRRIGDST